MTKRIKIISSSISIWAQITRVSAPILGLFSGTLIFIFTLFSGAEAYGNDFMAIIKNNPNALLWHFFGTSLALLWHFFLLFVWLTWKK